MARESTIYSTIPMQIYMMESIKKPIMQGLNTLFSPDSGRLEKLKAIRKLQKAYKSFLKMPRPTKENTWHPNTHRGIELRDKFFKHYNNKNNPQYNELYRNLFDFVLIMHDFDFPYRFMAKELVKWALEKEWTEENCPPSESWNLWWTENPESEEDNPTDG